MTPTMKLRIVRREEAVPVIEDPRGSFCVLRKKDVLQQWFRHDPDHDGGEWVDVPVEDMGLV